MPRPLHEHLDEIARRVAEASQLLVFLDYDGTLTPLVDRPTDARLDARMRQTIQTLAIRPATHVAVLSGRALDDVRSRVGIDELIYAGNHGLEIAGPGFSHLAIPRDEIEGKLLALASELEQRFRHLAGILIENKRLTLSVHYRCVGQSNLPAVHDAMRQISESLDPSLSLTTGNKVYEIRPRGQWNKGTASRWILDRLALPAEVLAICLGDDRTDEDTFRAWPEGITIKVGGAAFEEMTAARYQLSDPDEVGRFLAWLAVAERD